jgi:hypothetical protein
MRIGFLLTAFLLIALCCSEEQYSKAAAPVATSITKEKAVAIVWDLPEIKAWAKYIDAKTKGTVHAATMVIPEIPVTIKKKQYWSVNFYEDQPEYFHRWQSFMVQLDGKEILVDTIRPDDYISLQEWRTKEKPMERIRESKAP